MRLYILLSLSTFLVGLASSEVDKNFANPDCGAKVIEANLESLFAAELIKNTPDGYMLNECTDKPWFIVELCNHIYANKVAIAVEQLYSGTFKRLNISMSVTILVEETPIGFILANLKQKKSEARRFLKMLMVSLASMLR